MKFIFPKNYRYRFKFLGFIDYFTGIVDLIIGIFLYLILLMIKNVEIRIYVFVSLYSPVILFSIFGLGNENIISVVRYMMKYFLKQKVYLYK